jgi:hypothetical protein
MAEELQEIEEIEETEETPEVEDEQSVIQKIGSKVKEFFSGEPEVEEREIPDFFSAPAKELGWTEEEIQEFAADYSDEELDEMIPFLIGEDSSEEEETSDNLEEDETEEEKDKDSQEDERIQKLLDRIEALEKAQEKSLEEEEQQEIVGMVDRASRFFDDASDEFEIFGKTEELPKLPDGRIIPTSPQMKARSEVWELAYRLKGTGLDFDDAMSVALNSYKGKNLTKDVQRKVIKDLKKNEKRLGGKRTTHESTKELTNGPDIIREVARKAGKEIL